MAAQDNSPRILLWLVAIGFFMQTLDSTIVNTALPTMAESLGESPLYMHSVVIAYSLTIALLIPASGWIADRFGIRNAFMAAIIVFGLGSLLCALSQNLIQIIAARAIQGIGGALLLPVGRLAVLRCFPKEKFLEAISFVAIPGLLGPLIGPTLGGFLSEALSWHWIFLINIPIAILGCIASWFYMPDIPSVSRKRFDVSGYFMLATSMVAISLALEGLSGLGLQHATVIVLMVFGFAGLVGYGLHASRNSKALFPLRLFKTRTFTIGLAGNLFARIGSSGIPLLIPLLLQVSLDYSPLQAGIMMIPIAASAMLAKRIVTGVIEKLGYRRFLIFNTLSIGLVIASFALIDQGQPLWIRILQLSLFGMANSMQYSAMNSLTLMNLDTAGASSGNSLFSMVQMLALSFGVSAAGALLTTFSEKFSSMGDVGSSHSAFQATFICVGIMTCASAWIFWQLSPHAPQDQYPSEKPQLEMHS